MSKSAQQQQQQKNTRELRGGERVLDEAARKRRARKQLEALEADNFGDDPHANLTWHKNRPFDEKDSQSMQLARKKLKLRGIRSKQRFAKRLVDVLAEEEIRRPSGVRPNYASSMAPPSTEPPRKFCAVCGFFSNYKCMQCGADYCCIRCLEQHKDTRCQKWTA